MSISKAADALKRFHRDEQGDEGVNKILINSLGSGIALVNGILPWATVGTLGNTPNQYDFATLAAAGTGSSVAAFTNYKTSLATAGPTEQAHLPSASRGAQPAGRADGHDIGLAPRKLRQYRYLAAGIRSCDMTVIAARHNSGAVDVGDHREDRGSLAMRSDGSR